MKLLDLFRRKKTADETEKPGKAVQRAYAAAKHSRLTSDWTTATTSADAEIRSSLTAVRARTRALGRDSAYAKRARNIVVNNVVGQGIGLQCQVKSSRNRLMPLINSAIEEAFRHWSRPQFCHTGAGLDFASLERVLMGEVFEAGEVFVRAHFQPFGNSEIPFALELIESERVPHTVHPPGNSQANELRMGIEVDRYYRPIAYWIRRRHPSDFNYPRGPAPEEIERVPANEVLHLRVLDRWPQTRGMPWLHAVATKINDMGGYTEAEIVAARGAANYMGTIETDPLATIGEETDDGYREIEVAPGVVYRLATGEKFNFVAPNRPNAALDPFMRHMLREVAAGTDVSYEALSRDYSQSNYSSSRLALIDDRDHWRVLQGWFISNFRDWVHERWLQQAVLARAIPGIPIEAYAANPQKYAAVKYKPRGWSWVDPTKEVAAYKEAEKAGYITKTQVIAQTGGGQDFEDVMEERRQELDAAAELGLEFDTDTPTDNSADASPEPPQDEGDDDDESDEDDEGTESRGEPMRIIK